MRTGNLFDKLAFPITCIGVMVPIYILLAMVGDEGRARAAAIAAGDILGVARLSWDQRDKWWFWGALSFLGLVHIFAVEAFPWSNTHLLWISLLPIAVLDIGVGYGLIRLLQRVAASPDR